MTPIPILLYHSVAPDSSAAYRRWCIPPTLFAEHLDVIRSLGYSCLTVSGLVEARASGTLPPKPIAISFDDGRADFAEHAAPCLDQKGLPATIYVVSSHVGAMSSWLAIPEERTQPMMTWADLHHLGSLGIEVGSHSASHPQLDIIGQAQALDEIVRSKDELAQGLGRDIRTFAYPHGYHSATVAKQVEQAGFQSACAVRDRWTSSTDSRFALSRLVINGDASAEHLAARLNDPNKPCRRSQSLRLGWRAVRWARFRTKALF